MKSHIWMSPASGKTCAALLALRAESMVPSRWRRFWIGVAEIKRRRDEVHRLSGIVASLRDSLEGTPYAEDAILARSRCAKAHRALTGLLRGRGA